MTWTEVTTPALVVAMVSAFFGLLLRGDIRLGREYNDLKALYDRGEADKRDLEDRVKTGATTNATLQAATAETARQQAAVIDMLLKRNGGSS